MKHFIRQTVTMMMVTVLGISSMVQPITIKAQENSPIIEKEIAPTIDLPEDLKAKEGTPLKEIQLPEQWTWIDESILVSKDTREYSACLKVDDVTYNYETIEGYNPEKHDVEVLLTVMVEEPELTNPIQKAETPTTLADGDVEINATNFPDATFREYVKKFDIDKNDALSTEEIAKATEIVVTGSGFADLKGLEYFTALTTLNCTYADITSLDVSENVALQQLDCSSIKITSLDVSENAALEYLFCSSTTITNLDVSKNAALIVLHCAFTKITSLDVSENVALKDLDCSNTSLTYLNLGDKEDFPLEKPDETVMKLNETGTSFNISDKFPGFDISKVLSIEGATYDDKTGIVSDYKLGTPIVYVYDCGTAEGNQVTLKVTLTLVGETSISFNDELSKDYDGTAVTDKPEVTVIGSTGTITYTWEKKNDNTWETITMAPMDAGTYRASAKVEADANYNEATTTQEFTISQATNSWTEELSIKDWTYNETTNTPSATAKLGDVVFTYSNKQDGTYTDTVPTNAGTWYVKASVVGSDNYTGLESIKTFVIEPKNTDDIKVSEINKDTKLDEIIVNDGNTTLVIGKDYEVTKQQEGNQVTVTITFKENYIGTMTQTYTIEEKVKLENVAGSEDVITGDNSHRDLFMTLSILSLGCMIVVLKKRKKNIKE